MRIITYLDSAGKKKQTKPLTSAEEIQFFKDVKINNYTVYGVKTA